MREKKRLSDDMMEFIITQLKFKKADGPLLESFTKATVRFLITTSTNNFFQDWLGGAQSKVGKWMRTADKNALTVNDRQKIKNVLSIMNKELK